jgi:hypothetical protein
MRIMDRYELLKMVGVGGFASVYVGSWDNKLYAIGE